MALTVNQKRKLKQTWTLLAVGTLLGPIYIVFSDGFKDIVPFINAIIIAFLVSGLIAVLEIWLLVKGIRKLSFIVVLILRTAIYLVLITTIIVNVLVVSRMIIYKLSYTEVLNSSEFQYFIYYEDFRIAILYGLFFALSINFTRTLSRKMGQGMLLSHITGTYFNPVKQERIFMFLNVYNSKVISEKLGPLNFHKFLNDLFYDVTDSIILHRGIIYEYVEDLVVISWEMNKGIGDENCIRVFYHIQDKLEGLKEKYYARFDFFPKLRASVHCGQLIRAEIGDIKTQIVFHGDVMITTSRILDKCHEMKVDLMVSANLLYRIELPEMLMSESVGGISLKGKEIEVELFKITEKELVAIA